MSSNASAVNNVTGLSTETGCIEEPLLDADQIQGNIFPGFSKDHQTLLFLRIDCPKSFSKWLCGFMSSVATTADVLDFNRLYKRLRSRMGGTEPDLRTTWANIAFSFKGLKKLEQPGMNLDDFVDAAFKAGHLARSQQGELGDPVGSKRMGDPEMWLIGGPKSEADVVLLLAADTRADLNTRVQQVVETLFPYLSPEGETIGSGVSILFRQDGDILPGAMAGHEHFGFKDGISQPGIRGWLPDATPLTPSQNSENLAHGKPGQVLLWPGEFVFGYPGQDPNQDLSKPGKDPLKNEDRKAPEFARNGSFLVFRRLRQDVGGFHQFMNQLASRFGVATELVGAKMVGRWPSGAPTVLAPTANNPALADDDLRNNAFKFAGDDADPLGIKVPFAGHIRKTYPRNDTSESISSLNESTTQTHRLLRRGIPYGSSSRSTFSTPQHDDVDRGLLFLAYQVSIVDQFEFVTKNWANNPDFKDGGTGYDPIIGQNGDVSRRRTFRLGLPGESSPIEVDKDWVIPTGGGYFFAPSIDALNFLAGISTNLRNHGDFHPNSPPKAVTVFDRVRRLQKGSKEVSYRHADLNPLNHKAQPIRRNEMNQSNLEVAEAYYTAVEGGDYEKMDRYLHCDVKYVDPRWPLAGKEKVWPIAKSFSSAVKQLKPVARFSAGDKVMLVHDVLFHKSEKPMRTAMLMTVGEGLIKEMQLISDISQHTDACAAIFSYPAQPTDGGTAANQSNLDVAEAYYSAVERGDYEKMDSYLHYDVRYVDPRWPLAGKEKVWPIAKSFSSAVKQLKPVARFSVGDQVTLVHDVLFHKSEKPMRTAMLMTIGEGLIKEMQLISDISQHMDVCAEIFNYPARA